MNWQSYIKSFQSYLKIERGLSKNTIDNYSFDFSFTAATCFAPAPANFYLPEYGTVIEYNGLQHYSSTGLSQRSASSSGMFFLVA